MTQGGDETSSGPGGHGGGWLLLLLECGSLSALETWGCLVWRMLALSGECEPGPRTFSSHLAPTRAHILDPLSPTRLSRPCVHVFMRCGLGQAFGWGLFLSGEASTDIKLANSPYCGASWTRAATVACQRPRSPWRGRNSPESRAVPPLCNHAARGTNHGARLAAIGFGELSQGKAAVCVSPAWASLVARRTLGGGAKVPSKWPFIKTLNRRYSSENAREYCVHQTDRINFMRPRVLADKRTQLCFYHAPLPVNASNVQPFAAE